MFFFHYTKSIVEHNVVFVIKWWRSSSLNGVLNADLLSRTVIDDGPIEKIF